MKRSIKIAQNSIIALTLFLISQSAFSQSKSSTSAFEIKDEALKEYVGEYNASGNGSFNITISMDGESKLMAQPTDKSQPNTLLVTTKEDYFDLANTPLKINFSRNDAGHIESLTFSQGQTKFTAKRKGRS